MGMITRLARGFFGALRSSGGRPSGAWIAIIMALLTVLATGVAGLQQHASLEDDAANREAELIANEALGSEVGTVIQSQSEYGIYRRWYEELLQANWAQNQLVANPLGADAAFLQALIGVDTAIAEWATEQTPLLQPPYYDPETRVSDFVSYAAERTADTFRAREQRAIEFDASNAWSTKATTYITVLTILAAALFFLGIASTIRTAARGPLAFGGVALGVLALVWTIAALLDPIERTPSAAVDEVVRGNVALQKGTGLAQADLEQARPHFDAAIDAANRALGEDNGYLSAYLLRAQARLNLGNTMISKEGDSDESKALLEGALSDYRLFADERPEDPATWWNLGVTAYLAGEHQESVDASTKSIEIASNQFPVYMNRAIALLALGRVEEANRDVDRGLEVAISSGLDSNTSFFVREDYGLAQLAEREPEQTDAIRAIQKRLRETHVALRALGSGTPDPNAPAIGQISGVMIGVNALGEVVEGRTVEAGGTVGQVDGSGVRLSVTGTMDRDRQLSVRLFVEGLQDGSYTIDRTWPATEEEMKVDLLSPYGRAGFPLAPGAYSVEVYVDGTARGTFNWSVTAAAGG
jgi:tetratricopeptide (TPR) repeat protein